MGLAGKLPRLMLAANVCWGLPAASALAATATDDGFVATHVVRLVLGLAVVIAVLLGAARFMTRFGGAAMGRRESFHVVSSLPVGQRERVVVLQLGDRQVALGVAPGRVELLHVLNKPLDPERGGAPEVPANGWLARAFAGRSE